MGNNNVTGQQVSEESAHGVDKIIDPSNGSPGLNNTDDEKTMADNEKEGTKGEQVTSDQNHSPSEIEDADEKNRGPIQDNTSTLDDQSDNLSNEDHELVKDVDTETTVNPTEIITTVSTTIEDMISVKDSLVSSEKIKQLEHGTLDSVGESTMVNITSLFDENLEGSPDDGEEPRRYENAPMGDTLTGKDPNEILEKGYIMVSTMEDQLVAMQGEITSSTESIVSTYHDADDSEIKEVVIEDKPGQKDKPSCVQPLDATNIEISKGYTTEIPQEKENISAIIKTTITEPILVSDEVIEEDNPEYSACEVEQEPEKYELKDRVVSSRKTADSVTATLEHSGTERTYMKEEGIVDKTVAVHNLTEIFQREKKPEGYDGQLVSSLEGDGNLACLSSSYHLGTVNEGKGKRVNGILECDRKDTVKEIQEQGTTEINAEGLDQHINSQVTPTKGGDLCNLPMITTSTSVLSLEDFEKLGCIKPDSSDSNEGTITSTYGTRTIDTHDTITSSQRDQSQRRLLEEHEAVKLENGEILSPRMQLVEDRPKVANILTDDSNHEKAGVSAMPIDFTIESNQEGDTTTIIAEDNQVKVTVGVDKTTENQYPLQMSTPMRESSEETPFLQSGESIGSFSNSTEQHRKVSMDKPVTDISAMQCKAEADEESEKSPLLRPRELSGEGFSVPNHSVRKIKPFQNLLTEGRTGMLSPLKEQQSIPINNNVLVSSPRSKGKQKTRSSFFTNCMCCVTPTN